MADVSYVFRFGGYEIPNEYLAEDGYECTPNQRQDLDPWTDATGVTHRNVVGHTKSDVTLTFRALKWDEFTELITGITSAYSDVGERDAYCSYLDMETMTLKTGHFYLDPSCKFKVKFVNDRINSFSLRFTEY